ncbi:hypothetical protein DFW84_10040, partial [Campylobacter coli]|nr:hypothetical protein [Campylobacter coli]
MNYDKLNKIGIVLIIILSVVYFMLGINNTKVKNLEFKIQDLQTELNKTKKELNDTKINLNHLSSKVQDLKISLMKDMSAMHHLSDKQQSLILAEIWKQSKNYKINPAFLY